MINQSTAIVRKLKQFFDQRFGLGIWDQGKITHFGQGEDDIQEFVAYQSEVNGKRFTLRVVPPEEEPPLGKIEFHMGSVSETGPFDLETLERVRARLFGNSLAFDRSFIGGHL